MIKILKKIAIFVFTIFITFCQSYAALVSDNDGSAFITHSEFDSKVSDFNQELNKRLTGFSSKVDEQIVQYLEGIKINYNPDTYYARMLNGLNCYPYFMNSITGGGASNLTSQLSVNKEKVYSTQYKISSQTMAKHVFKITNYDTSKVGIKVKKSSTEVSDSYVLQSVNQWASPDPSKSIGMVTITVYGKPGTNIKYDVQSNGESYGSYSWQSVSPSGTTNVTNKPSFYNFICFDGTTLLKDADVTADWTYADGSTQLSYLSAKQNGALDTPTATTTYTVNNLITGYANRAGSGSAWEYRKTPNGNLVLQRYYSTFYPIQNIILSYKTYKNYTTAKTTVSQNDFKDDTTCNYTPTQNAVYGLQKIGTRYSSYSTATGGYFEQVFSLNKQSTDTKYYNTAQWGNNCTQTIYACEYNQTPVKTSTNLGSSYTNLAASTVSIEGKTHTTTAVTNNIYEMKVSPTQYALNAFENTVYSGIAGDTVKLGYGIPIMKTNADNSAKYRIVMNFKQTVAPAGTTVSSGNVTVRLSKNHFINGGFAQASDRVYEGTVTCNSSGVGTLTLNDITNIPKGQMLWLNLYGNTASRIVELTGFNVVMS